MRCWLLPCEAVSDVVMSWSIVQFDRHALGAAGHTVAAWEAAVSVQHATFQATKQHDCDTKTDSNLHST